MNECVDERVATKGELAYVPKTESFELDQTYVEQLATASRSHRPRGLIASMHAPSFEDGERSAKRVIVNRGYRVGPDVDLDDEPLTMKRGYAWLSERTHGGKVLAPATAIIEHRVVEGLFVEALRESIERGRAKIGEAFLIVIGESPLRLQ